jgi:hypothetical protein
MVSRPERKAKNAKVIHVIAGPMLLKLEFPGFEALPYT